LLSKNIQIWHADCAIESSRLKLNSPASPAKRFQEMKMDVQHRPKLLYPSMVIAAIAVTVFSLLGIATITGALPYAHSATGTGYGIDEPVESNIPGGTKAAQKKAVAACASCGIVESVNAVEMKGRGSGIGAVAGGITGALLGNGIGQGNGRTAVTILGAAGGAYAGNEIEKSEKKHTSYRIRVRMANGDIRAVYQSETPAVSSGDRVKIVDGGVIRQS
jgi:outer membrane lipoprotein SlyB